MAHSLEFHGENMAASIDLRKAHAARRYGDINAVLTWMNDDRVLILIPAVRVKAPWFVIMERVAFEWSDQDAGNLVYLPARAHKACEVLGIEPNKENCFRIISIVNDIMQEFLRMPSSQPLEKLMGSYGSMTLRANGEVVTQQDIRLDDEGVSYGPAGN